MFTSGEARSILAGEASGPVVASPEALSFWGGVDPATGSHRWFMHGIFA